MEIRILHIRMHGQHPPVNFTELAEACVEDNNIKDQILELIKLKSRSNESDQNPVDSILIKYAYERLSLIKHEIEHYRPEIILPEISNLDKIMTKWVFG